VMGRAIVGGMFGALVGTMALEVVDSLAFPLMRTFEPIASEQTPRVLMYVCVAVGAALLSGLAARRRLRKPVPAPAE
jgi:predicted lysophospholipase L1 biosynthesis ABC-type transport system permease subunit